MSDKIRSASLRPCIRLISAGLLLAAVNLYLGYELFYRALGYRSVRVESLDAVPGTLCVGGPELGAELREQGWFSEPPGRQKVLQALLWTAASSRNMNACSRIADRFRQVLGQLGMPTRKVVLFRNLFDSLDSHVSVEVEMDGRWVVLDPTLGLSYEDEGGRLLSAQEIKARLFLGGRDAVRVVIAGGSPVRPFYMDSRAFYNNVFLRADDRNTWWRQLPPLRYWLGPRMSYQTVTRESDDHVRFQRMLYFLVIVILPSAQLLLMALVLRRMFRSRSQPGPGA